MCSRVADLKFSGHCAQCVLDEPSDDMTIDVRDREAVLSIERAAAKAKNVEQQRLPLQGDPFCLYLPRQHVQLPLCDSQPNFCLGIIVVCV